MRFALAGFLSVLCLALAAGCGGPADDTPAARVSDPAAKEAASAPTEAAPVLEAPVEPVALSGAKVFVLTDQTGIGFEGSKVTGPHVGGFAKFDGTVTIPDGEAEGAEIKINIDLTSLFSDDANLTRVLKSADFFDVEQFPSSTFESTVVKATETGYEITGNLDLHGVTKSLTFPAVINVSEDSLTAEAEFTINRQDFGLKYKGAFKGIADNVIRDKVLILLDVEADLQ